jgi:D-3-phosphoglycerate dehydrogenase
MEGAVCIPHLGASTPESEDNCAIMACRQVKDYMDNGNIVNSVNLPVLTMAWAAANRVCVISKGADAAAVLAAVPGVVASASNTRGDYAYAIIDTNEAVDAAAVSAVPGVIRVRVLSK